MVEKITEKVKKIIDNIRPNLQVEGGDIELVGVDKGIVKVRLKGACAGCPMSTMTIKMGVESELKRQVPEVIKVETVL